MGSQVVGNIILAFVMKYIGQIGYVYIMIFLSVLATILTFFLRAPTIYQRTTAFPSYRLSEST